MVRQEKRLVLHFDVNKTLIIADPAMGIEMTEMINSLLAECAWGTVVDPPPGGELHVKVSRSITIRAPCK
jgi:hypothetical protein